MASLVDESIAKIGLINADYSDSRYVVRSWNVSAGKPKKSTPRGAFQLTFPRSGDPRTHLLAKWLAVLAALKAKSIPRQLVNLGRVNADLDPNVSLTY